jgi:hypothetical protein
MTHVVGMQSRRCACGEDPSDGSDGDRRLLFVWRCPAVWKRFHATDTTFMSLVAASATNWCSQDMKQISVSCASLEHQFNENSQCCISLLDLDGHSCSFDARSLVAYSEMCTISHFKLLNCGKYESHRGTISLLRPLPDKS